MKKMRWKIALAIGVIIVYGLLLGYIGAAQSDYRVLISTEKEEYVFEPGIEEYIIPIQINNQANRMLDTHLGGEIYFTYHLYDSAGNLLIFDNVRTPLEKCIFANSKDTLNLRITPMEQGEYIIGIDVVEEFVGWFSDHEEIEKKIKLIVK